MDCSSEYIKMCENSGDVQKQWYSEMGDFYVSMAGGITSSCQIVSSDLEKKQSYLKTIKAIWLPRQDQLQKMVIDNYATPWDLSIALSNILMGKNTSYFERFDSMEKLWLAFIMFEKYKYKCKCINGEWTYREPSESDTE
jgi:hypothetical protein